MTHSIDQHTAALAGIPQQPKAAAQSQAAVEAGVRLVPTQIGQPGRTATVWIECPTAWCTLDHANDRQIAVEDVWHSGEFVDLELPHRGGHELLAYFRLGMDPYSSDEDKRRPFVYGEDGNTANGYYMDADHLDAMCDRAEESIAKLRAMARACRGLAGGAA